MDKLDEDIDLYGAKHEVADMLEGIEDFNLCNLDTLKFTDFPEECEIADENKKAFIVSELPIDTSSISNTYKDLTESETGWALASGETMSMNEEINQLTDLSLKIDYPNNVDEIMNALEQGAPAPLPSGYGSLQLKLSFYIDKMPHGIVDKQVAGIGATTLEIVSKRNSIIVVPTKVLAYNKWIEHKHVTLYVGGKINKERDTTSNQEVKDHLANPEIAHKKFLVVADSLSRLLLLIKKEHYKDYFLMIDEVDMIQSESHYRPRLENLIDHYFEFPPKNRCLVTATMREFSNPRLQQECKFKLTWKDIPKRNIQLYHTDNLDALTASHIQSTSSEEKIVIAFNSIRHCNNIIKLLSDEIQGNCAILCSDSSKEEAGDYYAELTQENKLPKRVNFITSCYFSGVDIKDTYHLITVSNARRNYQMLSLDKMTQIHGRCRLPEGLLSDTVIFNTREKWRKNIGNDYQTILLKQASAVLQLQKATINLGKSDKDLQDLFEVVKSAIRDKAIANIPNDEPVQLTRKNCFGEEVPAYMNIDYLVERQKLSNTIYDSYEHLLCALKKQGHIIKFANKWGMIPRLESQKKIAKSSQNELQNSIDAQLTEVIEKLSVITKSRQISAREKQDLQLQRGCSTFVHRFYLLQDYADAETLLNQLWEIRHLDRRAYKNLQNAAVFWALDDAHPFKRDLVRTFKTNKRYTATELCGTIIPIVKYHLHKTIKQRAAITLLKALFQIERPRNYLIKELNPMGFKVHGKLRIQKTEENLLKYFQF